jgi:hypothetical protein
MKQSLLFPAIAPMDGLKMIYLENFHYRGHFAIKKEGKFIHKHTNLSVVTQKLMLL